MAFDPSRILYLSRKEDVELTRKHEQIDRWAVRTRSEIGRYTYEKSLYKLEFSTPAAALRFRDAWFPHLPDPAGTSALTIEPERWQAIHRGELEEWTNDSVHEDRPFHTSTVNEDGEVMVRLLFRSEKAATHFKLRWL